MNARFLTVLVALLWCSPGHADDLSLPALGIRLTGLPAGSAKAHITEYADSYDATLEIGAAKLSIMRLKDSVPTGSSITNPAQRSSLLATFNDDNPGRRPSHAGATTIGEHEAWTIAHAWRAYSGGPIDYRCVSYVIANGYLYQLTAYAASSVENPPDYTTAVRIMSYPTFVPVDVASSRADIDGSPGKLRVIKYDSHADYYPPKAQRLSEQGIVDAEFLVDGRGHPHDIKIVYSEAADFDRSVRQLIANASFAVSRTWVQDGFDRKPNILEVHFHLAPPESDCRSDAGPPHAPGADRVSICVTMGRPLSPQELLRLLQ